MSEETAGSPSGPLSLPDHPNLDWLRKQAKRRLEELLTENPSAQLSDAQFDLAKQYGFPSWRALKAHIDSLTVEGQLFDAASKGDDAKLVAMLDAQPAALHARNKPYEWTLLHTAAQNGRLSTVNLLLERGLDVNSREKGDNTVPLHWAAAAGHVDVVRRLVEAGSDVIGHGDDHELEIIGWATCWEGCDDDAHHAVVDILLAHGARHHIFSAIAMRLADEVRRIVADDPTALSRRMSRNENNQTPLHFAVRMARPDMVDLLLELGADPLVGDASGYPPAMYADNPDSDRAVMEAIRTVTFAEFRSADRGSRKANGNQLDLLAAVSLGDWDTAGRLARDNPDLLRTGGALHLVAKRNDERAVKWLLDHGADPNSKWVHWEADVTPLHMAAWYGHAGIARLLLAAGADPRIHDSKHDSDPLGWAEYAGKGELVRLLKSVVASEQPPRTSPSEHP